jgi:hypothetical protein
MLRAAAALACISTLGLCACGTTPPVQPLRPGAELAGGFIGERLDESHYRVTLNGADSTPRAQVDAYLLYRAAELTALNGCDWFEMVGARRDGRAVAPQPVGAGGWGYWRPRWTFHARAGWGDPWGGPYWGAYDVDRYDSYQATADIAIHHGPKPRDNAFAFDARQVMQSLGPKIIRPGEAPDHS